MKPTAASYFSLIPLCAILGCGNPKNEPSQSSTGGYASEVPATGGVVTGVTAVGGTSTGGTSTGGAGTGGQPPVGSCTAELVGGDPCDPAIDSNPCELPYQDCTCSAVQVWACVPKTAGVGGTGGSGGGTGGAVSAAGGSPGELALENTGVGCVVPALAEADQLPQISTLPDPFTKLDGSRMIQRSEWQCRRQEIHKQAEKYIYGEKPPKPTVVMGSVGRDAVSVHVEENGKSIDFSADILLPPTGQGPFPAIINVGAKGGFGGITLGENRILEQGVAVIYYDHYELGMEGAPEQSRGQPNPGLFYDIYGGDHSAGLLMAWAWGASRLMDVLQQSGGGIVDATGIGVTGCSRNGKGAFAIGVFDERIALTIPQETSTAGVPAYRIVDVLGQERTDHNYYGLNWLSNDFEPFVFGNGASNAVKLPIDSHSLVAMVAPRGLLVLENPHQAQMGAPAGHVATVAGAEVYQALGVEGNVSYHSDVSDTLHCSYKQEYTDLLVENIATFLKHEGGAPGEFEVGANGSGNLSEWKDWDAPLLQD